MHAAIKSAAVVLFAVTHSFAQVPALQVDQNVTVGAMTSDRFIWRDAANQERVAVLAHNTGQTGPGGTRGGELREFRYVVGGGVRVVSATSGSAGGFGYVVAHPDGSESCIGGPDTSSFGHFQTGTFTRVFQGKHHAIFRFNQNYPRYCSTMGVPAAPINIPVTIEWVFSTGRNNPLWAVTWDMSAIDVNRLKDDSRAPYGEMLFDGAIDAASHSTIAGVGWGDRYKFATTDNPVTLESDWTWNVQNTIPYVKLWTTAVDATMGVVQSQTIMRQDAGGYWGVSRWNSTSAAGNACTVAIGGRDHLMPCDFNWPYQLINYSFAGENTATNNTRMAWGTNFGFLGQSSYSIHGAAEYGGPLGDATAPGWPRKSYSTYVVFGTHTSGAVESQVAEVEALQSVSLTATTGSVATEGPGGVGRVDLPAYQPAGYDHVYGALTFVAAANRVTANIAVGSGTVVRPLIIVRNYTGAEPQVVRFGGASLTADVDYFASVRPGSNELWLTLNRSMTGPTNQLMIAANVAGADFSGDGKTDIVLRNYTTGQNAVWIMNGTALSSIVDLPLLANTSYRIEGTADFNANGSTDIVLRNYATGQNALWLMSGTAVSAVVDLPALPNTAYHFEGTGDFTGDGKADLILRNYVSGQNALWVMNGTALSSIVDLPALPNTSYRIESAGDFNNDGKTDIVLRNYATGQNALWLMNGTSLSSIVDLPALPNTSYRIDAVGDFNADSRPDIVLRNYTTGQNAVWLMNGTAISSIVDLPALPNTSFEINGPR